MSKKKSWSEKFSDKNEGFNKVHDSTKGPMYISSPKEIEKLIKKVPKGKLTSTKEFTDYLTKKYKTEFTCPLTTGIFVSIVANKTEEERIQGKKDLTPYWRVIKANGDIYDRYLGQPSHQMEYLEAEGFTLELKKSGKGHKVKDYKKFFS